MAVLCRHVLRRSTLRELFFPKPSVFTGTNPAYIESRRLLFSNQILGLDDYQRQKAILCDRMGEMKEKFRIRMEEYMNSTTKSTIFTDDLKTMVYIAETHDDLDTVVKMIKRFQEQSSQPRFSSFTFGPLVMRMLHLLKQPKLAYDLFMDPKMEGFFDQMTSYVTLMDQLFEGNHHQEVLHVFSKVKERQLAGFKFPMDCLLLALASCLKMNNPEVYEDMLSVLEDCKKRGIQLSTRCQVYAAVFALKQDKPGDAMEILAIGSRSQSNGALQNVKIWAYVKLDRVDEAVQMLRSVIESDVPDGERARTIQVFQETVELVREAVAARKNRTLSKQFEMVEKSLKYGNYLIEQDFEEYIFNPVIRTRQLQEGYKSRHRHGAGGYFSLRGRRAYRPGLLEEQEMSPAV